MTRSVAEVTPATEPVSQVEAKSALDIAIAVTGHDAEVDDIIPAARAQYERDTNKLTVSRTIVEDLSTWPDEDWRFYFHPVVSITKIDYLLSGSKSTLSAAIYGLDAPNRKIHLSQDQVWPSHDTMWDAIEVTYVAGQSTVTEIDKRAIILLIKIYFGDMSNEATEKHWKAYHSLVESYGRGSYP